MFFITKQNQIFFTTKYAEPSMELNVKFVSSNDPSPLWYLPSEQAREKRSKGYGSFHLEDKIDQIHREDTEESN
jgi:hypothetical protein